jgi:predicted O-linked N-acetylglucosamine transferase (SPINDLY family)
VSGDFRDHPVAFLTAGMFEHHDRDRFETFAISLSPFRSGAMHERLAAAFTQFIDVSARTDTEIIKVIRDLGVDIAVDLAGYTRASRPGIFAGRAAPIQVSHLGFPGTMGSPFIDYIIADRIVIPPELREHYAERVVDLPDTFQANDAKRRDPVHTPTRADMGLPPTGFVFCAFHSSYKLNPAMFEIWMRLLRQIDGSVLWLVADDRALEDNLRREARARGVSPDRLVFAGRLPYADHLARQRLADLFLDALPFNGGTTTSDALWMGLPVLTRPGEAFASRMSASLLAAVGLPELVVQSVEDYAALALRIARDPDLLRDLKARLAGQRATHPLFDTARFTRHIEAAYVEMWERHRRGEPPAHFSVPPLA